MTDVRTQALHHIDTLQAHGLARLQLRDGANRSLYGAALKLAVSAAAAPQQLLHAFSTQHEVSAHSRRRRDAPAPPPAPRTSRILVCPRERRRTVTAALASMHHSFSRASSCVCPRNAPPARIRRFAPVSTPNPRKRALKLNNRLLPLAVVSLIVGVTAESRSESSNRLLQ
jgi:hypothetical protein